MEQQLIQEERKMDSVDIRVMRIKETIEKIWQDPKAMKEIEKLIDS